MLNTNNNQVKSASGGDNNLNLFKERFRQYMQIINRAKPTIEGYMHTLERFIQFLIEQQGIFNVEQIKRENITMYQKHVFYQLNYKGEQNTPSTQNTILKSVRAFCLFLYEERYLAYNPAKGVPYVKEPKHLPRTILTHEEIKKLFKACNINTPIGYRDRTILEVLYSTGIRRKELLNLRPEHIDYDKGFLRINDGKGSQDRMVPLGKIACKYLENYIKLVRIDLEKKKGSPYLFISLQGNALSDITIHDILYKYARKAKINKAITPHVFRHTCATHLLQQKANIRCVQEILGHKCVETTQRYTQITITDLKEAHKNCHPREREKMY